MDWDTVLRILPAVGGPATVIALYKWAVAQGKKEALAEQTGKTLSAKDEEIAELKAENKQLWSLLEGVTNPPGRSS